MENSGSGLGFISTIASVASTVTNVASGGALPIGTGGSKMGYDAFIKARDQKLRDLTNFGAKHNDADGCNYTPLGWGYELCQGFTHSQIKRDYLKDYTQDYQRFLDVVYWPVLQKVNPTVYAQQRAGSSGGSSYVAPQNNVLATSPKTNMLLLVGGAAAIGTVLYFATRGKKKLSGLGDIDPKNSDQRAAVFAKLDDEGKAWPKNRSGVRSKPRKKKRKK